MIGRLLAVALAAVAVLYGRAWQFDLHCDELVFVRPWSWAELTGVLHGTWDPQHVVSVFFRPLTAWFFAGTFEAFGVDATAHMLLSLALLAAVVFALGVFVAREGGSTALGALTAVTFALHPNTPWSTGVWVTNDFHKLAALAILSALLIWQRVRHRSAAAWWPLLLVATVAFLIKEDNIVLLPALLTLQWARARWIGDVSAPTRVLWLIGVVMCGGLWVARWSALGQLGGLPLPSSVEMVVRNLLRGPFYALTLQGHEANGFSVRELVDGVLLVTMIAVAARRLRGLRGWLMIVALVIVAWYDAPLALISNVSRFHIITLGGSIIIAGAVTSLWSSVRGTAGRGLVTVGLGALALMTMQRQQSLLSDFAVCGRLPLACRSFLLENAPGLPPEARAFTMNMPSACLVNDHTRLDQRDTLTWGLGAAVIDTMTLTPARDAGPNIVALLRPTGTSATITMRHPEATPASPIDVAINVNGRDVATLRLTTTEWSTTSVSLTPGWRTWLRGMHRADVRVTAGGAARGGAEWQAVVVRP